MSDETGRTAAKRQTGWKHGREEPLASLPECPLASKPPVREGVAAGRARRRRGDAQAAR